MNSQDCFICQKHRGEVSIPGGAIYEDDLLYVGHVQVRENHETAYLGYLMVETKRHIPGLYDLNAEEASALGQLVARVSRSLKETEKAEHIYAFVIGDGVPHLHVHVVARYPGAPREYWGPRVDDWPDAPHGGSEAIVALCARVKAHLEQAT